MAMKTHDLKKHKGIGGSKMTVRQKQDVTVAVNLFEKLYSIVNALVL
jgi:hypothetical protein